MARGIAAGPPRGRRPKAEPSPTTPDPIEIAMEAEAGDVSPHSPARRLLVQQERLVGWQIANERIGFALRALLGLAGLAAAAALGFMAWSASQADGLVVEAFSVPPQLADQGLTGAVVAGEVMDQLGQLNRETNNPALLRISDTWSRASRVEIPQTGITLDELNRLLRRWLGRETVVTGAVTSTPTGIALSARATDGRIVRAAGAAGDMAPLSAQLAELILADARPLRYGVLMAQRLRFDEALAACARATRSPDKQTRAAAHFQCGAIHQTKGDIHLAGSELRRSWALGERAALYNLVYVERGLGHDETALAMARQTLGLNRSTKDATGSIRLIEVARGHHELQIGDYLGARDDFATALTPNGNSALTAGRQYENLAAALIGLHDTGAARRQIAILMSGSIYRDRLERFRTALEVRAAAQDEDWARVLQTLDAGHPRPTQGLLWTPTPNAWRALALGRLGRLDEADRYAAALPLDCNTCLRVRAHLAEARGSRAQADRWFAEAVRQAPSSPFGDEAWGRVLLARGDLQGAVRLARSGAKKSPNFADPVELWGEALLAQGDAKAAAAKFAEAAKLAPRWGRLHLKWGEALAKLGKADAARVAWRAAAGMDLSPADRAAVTVRLAERTR